MYFTWSPKLTWIFFFLDCSSNLFRRSISARFWSISFCWRFWQLSFYGFWYDSNWIFSLESLSKSFLRHFGNSVLPFVWSILFRFRLALDSSLFGLSIDYSWLIIMVFTYCVSDSPDLSFERTRSDGLDTMPSDIYIL